MTQAADRIIASGEQARVVLPEDARRADDPVHVKVLGMLADDSGARKVADIFGLESLLAERFRKYGRSIETVDPSSADPVEQFDLAIVSNVLSRLSQDEVELALTAIRSVSPNAAFIVSLTFADHVLSDGTNAHRTIQSKDWWVERIANHFEHAEIIPFPGSNEVCIVTWAPSSSTLRKLTQIRKTQTLKRVVPEMVTRPFRYALRKIQPGFIDDHKLAERARDKSIAIVGNSPKLAQSGHGAAIDAHDIVLRLKRCPIIDVRSYGQRTDWFATAVDFEIGLFRDRDPSLFLWLSYRKHPPLKIVALGCPVYCADRKDQKRGAAKLDAPPSIGFTAVDLILSLPARAVTIYGFDGMKTASLSSQFTRQSTVIHDHIDEMEVIEQMAREHGRTRIVPLS